MITAGRRLLLAAYSAAAFALTGCGDDSDRRRARANSFA